MAVMQRYADITAEQKAAFYDMVLLTRALPNFPHFLVSQLGRSTAIPKGEGDTVDFRAIAALSAVTTALTEGETPDAVSVTVSNTTATVSQYGSWVQVTDLLEQKSIDPMVTEISGVLGEQAGLTLDTLARDVAIATTSIVYPGSHSAYTTLTANAADRFSAALILKALRTLHNNNARPFSDGKYKAIISPYTWLAEAA